MLLEARDYVLENIDAFKRDHSLLHFEDLRSRLSDTLTSEDGKSLAAKIRQSWPFAMIDESQDTDPQQNGIFQSIYFRDPNGHRLELAVNTQTPEEMAELRRVAPGMLDEWHQTRQAPRHAAWLHEKEFNPETV